MVLSITYDYYHFLRQIMSFYEGCLFDVYESQPDPKEAHNMACSAVSALMTECREMGTPPAAEWRDVTTCRKLAYHSRNDLSIGLCLFQFKTDF